jgi:AraC-like DNA-binding protein
MATRRERFERLKALLAEQPSAYGLAKSFSDEALAAGENELAIRALLACAIATHNLGRPEQADRFLDKASRLAIGLGSPLAADAEYLRSGFLRVQGEHDASVRGLAALAIGPSFKQLRFAARVDVWHNLAELCRSAQAADTAVACLAMAERECAAADRPMPQTNLLNHVYVQLDLWFGSHPLFASMLPAGPPMRLSDDVRQTLLTEALRRCELLLQNPEPHLPSLGLSVARLLHRIGCAVRDERRQTLLQAVEDFHAMHIPTPRAALDLRARLVRASLVSGEIAAAMALVASAPPYAEPQIDAPMGLQWLYLQSQVARADGRSADALTLYESYVQQAMPMTLRMNLQVRELMHSITQQRGARPQDNPRSRPAYLDHAKRLIQQQPRLAIAAVAEEVSVTERTLHLAFSVHEGASPKAFQTRMRLEAVRRSIESGQSSGRTLEELAEEHGFSHAGRFSSAFKKLFGVSPRSLREQAAGTGHGAPL